MNGLNGSASFRNEAESGAGKLTITVACFLEGVSGDVRGFVDTGAYWPIIPGDLAREAGLDLEGPGLGFAMINTRLGSFEGHLERVTLTIPADEGEDLVLHGTWLVAPDWFGPLVLGWKGCLDRFQWGIQPDEARFYFGPL